MFGEIVVHYSTSLTGSASNTFMASCDVSNGNSGTIRQMDGACVVKLAFSAQFVNVFSCEMKKTDVDFL